jgi:hypothetical protein
MANIRPKILLSIFLFAAGAFAQQVDKARMDAFKKESSVLTAAVEEAVSGVVPGRSVLETAKATYLEGYGAVVTLEASLEPTRSPFTSAKTPAEVRQTIAQRRRAIQQKIETVLKQRTAAMQSVGSKDAVTIVLYLLNSNPADVPDLPSQVVFTARKDDPSQVSVREY